MKSILRNLTLAAAVIAGASLPAAAVDTEHAFDLFDFDGASGYAPQSGVVADRHGTIFGDTTIGGNGPCIAGAGCGTVYALSHTGDAGHPWSLGVLYNFQGGQDGSFPQAPLALDDAGSVYGYNTAQTPGTVFQLSPPKRGGSWKFHIVYIFTGNADGNLEVAGSPLVVHRGALYGIASGGSSNACGQFGCGSVFRLKRDAGGTWTEKTLYNFTGGDDGGVPIWIAGVDSGGAVYVSTSMGNGAISKIAPPAGHGPWTATVISRFADGGRLFQPTNLILMPDGTLYGIAGATHGGVAFQLLPPQPGGSKWRRHIIANVNEHGYGPISLAPAAGGALVGAIEGDFDFYAGSVFELTPNGPGNPWTYTELWNFNRGPDRNPQNAVTGRGGHLFGVLNGGDSTSGSLFELR